MIYTVEGVPEEGHAAGLIMAGECAQGGHCLAGDHAMPGGELVHLDDVVREGERAGLDVVGMRNLCPHYALTCRAWVKNLQQNAARCRDLVGAATYRTWLLYLAASAVGFEDGRVGAAQVLFRKRARA